MERIEWTIEVQRLLLTHPFTISRGGSARRDTVRLGITCNGVTGWGEAAPNPRYSESTETALAALEKLSAIGEGTPFSYRSFLLGHRGSPGPNYAARAAFDLAVHDWFGRSIGMPLYQMVESGWMKPPPPIPNPIADHSLEKAVDGRFIREAGIENRGSSGRLSSACRTGRWEAASRSWPFCRTWAS